MTRSHPTPRSSLLALCLALALTPPVALGAQDPAGAGRSGSGARADTVRGDAYLDPVARDLHGAARAAWREVDEAVLRYTATIRQRIAAAIRTPLKDRTVYRNESAVRAFWDRDHDPLIQVLGARAQYPGRSRALQEGDLDFLDDLAIDDPFEPGGDRLFFGLSNDDEAFDPESGEVWFAHPLAPGADSLYRYRSGDTLTLALPDGRRLQTVQLDVLPRQADVHRISGALWIEPESGALVRAVFRLSDTFDAIRDIPELQAQEAAGSFRFVPGLFKPWTFDMTLVAIDYALWDFRVWLPRSMRVEAEVAAGILKLPVSMDVSYRMESVTLEGEASDQPDDGLVERRFETRSEAMAFIASLLSEGANVEYRSLDAVNEGTGRGRDSRYLVPEDPALLARSPELPPPIWEEAPGFASDEEIAQVVGTLADLPTPPVPGVPWAANWGWSRPDLIRYNRVEGPAVGGRFQARFGGSTLPLTLRAEGFFGFADLEPKARLDLERSSVRRRVTLGGFRELRATQRRGRFLGPGNSMNALLFGRDFGEYFRATGVDFRIEPPEASRASFEVRAYAERHDPVETGIDFALFRSLAGDFSFRPNVEAQRVEEAGAEVFLAPWWGTDPTLPQVGLELYAHGGAWRPAGGEGEGHGSFARTRGTLRLAVPLDQARWRVGVEAGGGTSWGEVPVQRSWFLGGPSTLRGYGPSVVFGSSFLRGRVELARSGDVGTLSVFGDGGWAGEREAFRQEDILYGVGVGGSILDGLIRMDLSYGLDERAQGVRLDLYLDAIL